MNLKWIFIQFLPTLGFVLALLLLAHLLRERRSPTSTMAWLLAIVFVPYLGVPLYLMIGSRKMVRRTAAKRMLRTYPHAAVEYDHVSADDHVPSVGGWYPKVRGNRVALLVDGQQVFERIMAMIAAAKGRILVTTYILARDDTGDAILRALTRRAAKGVSVCLLMDDLGSFRIRKKMLEAFRAAGGQAAFFMPMLHLPFRGRANLRNHRKMVLADNREAIIGGMNLAAEYMGPGPDAGRWRDLCLRVSGPVVAHMVDLFRLDWQFAAGNRLSRGPMPEPAIVSPAQDVALQLVAGGPDVARDPLREIILGALFRAQQRVWIVTPYFVPDELLLEALCLAARRGIELRLIIPHKSNHLLADLVREAYLNQLQESGAQVWLYQKSMLHAKAILIDDVRAVVGSANMDMRSLLLNYEAGLFVESRIVVGDLETWALQLLSDSILRSRAVGPALGLVESVARLFAPLL
jgi:cardiolipin synthase